MKVKITYKTKNKNKTIHVEICRNKILKHQKMEINVVKALEDCMLCEKGSKLKEFIEHIFKFNLLLFILFDISNRLFQILLFISKK